MDNEIEINTKEAIYKINGINVSTSSEIVVIINPGKNKRSVKVKWN